MSQTNQGSRRPLASHIAVIAVLGYAGSYIPSLFAYWEETWYPHGRELRVIIPEPETDPMVVAFPTAPDGPQGTHSHDAGRGWSLSYPPLQAAPNLQASQLYLEQSDSLKDDDSGSKESETWTGELNADRNLPLNGLGTGGLATRSPNGQVDET